ncbi:MAG: ABC transporter substrate-binding protein [Syntrophobacteraceae bacterium]
MTWFHASKKTPISLRRKLYPALLLLGMILAVAQAGEARLLSDQTGRKVEVPENPRRVVSLAPTVTEIVFALGKGDLLKGVTEYSDYPPQAERLPRVGSYVRLDLEKIVALKPDLCIADRNGNPENEVKELEAFGIPVYVVDPRSLNTTIGAVLGIGRLLCVDRKAHRLANEMRAKIERIKERIAKTNRRPRVFFQIGTSPLVSVGTHTLINGLIEAAGGQNVAAGPAAYPRFGMEEVLALRPDIIIVTSMTGHTDLRQVKAEWDRFRELPAVKNNRIFVVNADLFDRASPRLVEGLATLARLLHPELFR